MTYIADLHIHSRYSRATSKDGTPEYLDLWARRKGIQIVGTGDFTHPAWREELREKLEPAEQGLYVLKKEYVMDDPLGRAAMQPRFVISGEISSIYKKDGKVRKVHSLILLPGLEEAELLSKKLETIGNLHSDGRPILGLDCHDLLEIMLELCPTGIYVPAHIWTPHFSVFGAFSGFNTLEECFGDLTKHIHAVETGLSSDPPMNWRLSVLDSCQLISNSDAHSPAKLGREANLLSIELSYEGLSAAIQEGKGLDGTIEFFPEEGKYHFDGHRKCHLCLSPAEAEKYNGKCPVCGKKLTVGVSHRVNELADREEGFVLPGAKPFESLVPLPEVIAASTGHSAASRKVLDGYEEMLRTIGPEFTILRDVPIEEIRSSSGFLISEGIRRLREGLVERHPGFDGEYGTVRLFSQREIENLDGQLSLFDGVEMAGSEAAVTELMTDPGRENAEPPSESSLQKPEDISDGLNAEQRTAATEAARAIAVIAGPGTGKTKTLTARVLYLLEERGVKGTELTAVTFTKKAAGEMRERLESRIGKRAAGRMRIGTFHSVCLELLKSRGISFTLADDFQTLEYAGETVRELGLKMTAKQFLRRISMEKTGLGKQVPEEAAAYYGGLLKRENILDFDDLLLVTLELLQSEEKREIRGQKFSYLLVDEFQDISPVQYQLIKAWNRDGKELFVIGDPDQAIYSFRGSDERCFERLAADYPNLRTVRLEQNYRSTKQILTGAVTVIEKNGGGERRLTAREAQGLPIRLVTAGSELAEGIFAAKEINRLIGGIDMLDVQDRYPGEYGDKIRSFADIAILYRTHRQAEILEMCLQKEGIPCLVAGRDDFLSDDKVRGTVCFFRQLADPSDETSKRICRKLLWELPDNAVTGAFLDAVTEKYQKRWKKEKPQKLLTAWMEELELSGHPEMEKLRGMAVCYKDMPSFLNDLAFGTEGDLKRCGGKSYTSDAVTLMTLHGSKGLEFPVVFLCGARKGLMPLEYGKETGNEAEERRLFYVGMTRAKEELILVTSGEPSEFIADIPEKVLLRESAKRRENQGGEQLSLLIS